MAAQDPEACRRNATEASAAFWQGKTPDERQAHLAKAREGLRAYFADQVDPHRQLDETERDRQIDLYRRRMMAAAQARSLEVRRGNAAAKRRRQSDGNLDELISVVAGLLVPTDDLARAS